MSTPQKIKLGDDYVVNAEGIGNVNLVARLENGETKKVVLTDVLYVPDLGAKLFSVRAVTEKMFAVNFSGDKCKIQKNGEIMA